MSTMTHEGGPSADLEVSEYTPPVAGQYLGGLATAAELLATPPDKLMSGPGAEMLTEGTTVLPNGEHKKDFDP